MKRNQFSKKLISMAASMAIAMSAAAQLCITPVSAAYTEAEIGNYIQNGSFEAPDIDAAIADNDYSSSPDTGDGISYANGWMVTSKETYDSLAANKFHWNTTAYNQRIEIVDAADTTDNFFGTETDKSAAHGDQFAELVAEEESSLYQNITTTPESTLTWSISHRARVGTTANDKNSMAVFVGPEQTGLKKQSRESNDIFKQMAMLLYTDFNNLAVGMSSKAITLYSVPVEDGMKVTEDSVSKYYSADKYTQEWKCWIITSDTAQWYEHSDTYKVPDKQTKTTLAFAALNGGKDSNVYLNAGNLIDDVRFGVMYPLNVSTTPGGQGIVKYNNDDLPSKDDVTLENSPYIKNFEKDTAVTIKAVPNTKGENNKYKFIGARIDGKIVNVNATDESGESSIFTSEEDGSYSFKLTMNQSHHVVLFFALTGKVVYAPNEGTFNDAAGGFLDGDYGVQKVYESSDDWSLTQNAAPSNNGKDFAGWTVVSDKEVYFVDESGVKVSDYDSEFIPANHKVTCADNDDKTFTYTITYSDGDGVKTLIANSSDRTLLFVAEYYNTLTVKSCYVSVGDVTVHGDPTGGTATIDGGNSNGVASAKMYSGQKFTLTAVPKIGYKFMGWYLQTGGSPDDVIPITSEDTTYTASFDSNTDMIIHAAFVETAVNPKLAVIGQDPDAKQTLNNRGITNNITGFTDGYGGNKYGNTISTSFTLERNFSDYTTGDIGGVWTVYIPTNGTFMKVPSDSTGIEYIYLDMTDSGKVVEDTGDVQFNRGTIYSTKDEALGQTEKFEFYVHSNTTVTDGTAVFGLVIDNVYAPNATAGFKVTDTDSKPEDVGELNDNNSIYTKREENGEYNYEHNENILSGNSNAESK